MSIQQNFPAISPSLNLNFARSKTLDPRITFSRTTTATRVNEQGLVEVVSADIPRFDHEYDASTGVIKSLGLLVEEGRTNLTENSETLFDYSNTRVSNNTISTGGPFGTGYHEKTITEVGGQYNFHSNNQISITSGQTITFSIFFKNINIDANQIYLRFWTGTGRAWTTQRQVRYNLTNLTTSVSSGTIVNSSIQPFSDDWYRLSMTATADQDGFAAESFYTSSNSVGEKYQLMGAQVEVGAFPTSYIPTSGGTATRNPDSVSMTGDNFLDWYNQTEGTLFTRYKTIGDKSNQMVAQIRSTDGNNRVEIRAQAGSSQFRVEVIDEGATQQQEFSIVPSGYTVNNYHKITLGYKENDFASTINGTLYTDDSGTVGSCDYMMIGAANYGSGDLNGHISQLTYYPRRLTNTQLQSLTK